MFSDARRASAGWVPPGRLRPTVGLASLNGRTLLPCHSFTKAVRPDRSGKPYLASDGRFRNSNQGTPFLHPRRHWSLPRRIAGRQEPGGRREDRAKRRARDARPGSASPPERTRDFFVPPKALKLASFGNDPSAGSPTETLLRLLLPLNDQV